MTILYLLPWALWVAAFFLLEGLGFRKGHDRWPTLSEIVKGWEDRKLVRGLYGGVVGGAQFGEPQPPAVDTVVVERKGLVSWTWRRWLVAIGLPILGILLEAHWVLEWL